MGPTFNFNSQFQSLVLHLRSVSIFSFFLFSVCILVEKQVGKHASIYFIFIFSAHMFFFFIIKFNDDVGQPI